MVENHSYGRCAVVYHYSVCACFAVHSESGYLGGYASVQGDSGICERNQESRDEEAENDGKQPYKGGKSPAAENGLRQVGQAEERQREAKQITFL